MTTYLSLPFAVVGRWRPVRRRYFADGKFHSVRLPILLSGVLLFFDLCLGLVRTQLAPKSSFIFATSELVELAMKLGTTMIANV